MCARCLDVYVFLCAMFVNVCVCVVFTTFVVGVGVMFLHLFGSFSKTFSGAILILLFVLSGILSAASDSMLQAVIIDEELSLGELLYRVLCGVHMV